MSSGCALAVCGRLEGRDGACLRLVDLAPLSFAYLGELADAHVDDLGARSE